MIFKGMERAFVRSGRAASRARSGTSCAVATANGVGRSGSATAGRRSAAAPVPSPPSPCATSVPDFVRLAAREAFAPKLLLEGALVIEGDFALAGRLGEMFGEPLPT